MTTFSIGEGELTTELNLAFLLAESKGSFNVCISFGFVKNTKNHSDIQRNGNDICRQVVCFPPSTLQWQRPISYVRID